MIGPKGLALREANGPVGTLSLKLSRRSRLWPETGEFDNATEEAPAEFAATTDSVVANSGESCEVADCTDEATVKVPIGVCP